MPRKRAPTAAELITDAVYDRAKVNGYPLEGLYPATLKRVRELLEETADPAQVEVVALACLELDGAAFVAHRSLSWGTYDYVRSMLDVPSAGWGYALLLEHLPEGRMRDSVDYWLRRWRDYELVGDEVEADRCRRQLEKLRQVHEDELEAGL